MKSIVLLTGFVAIVGCGSSASTPDMRMRRDFATGTPDDLSTVDLSGDSSICTLGTATDCGGCGRSCPGVDGVGTTRLCSSSDSFGQCNVLCKGDYFDVNGSLNDGCELHDPDGAGSTLMAAKLIVLGEPPNHISNTSGALYRDGRMHDPPPSSESGDDIYKIVIMGAGDGEKNFSVCVGIAGFPSTFTYQACLTNSGTTDFASPTDSVCINAVGMMQAPCFMAAPNGAEEGTFHLRVRSIAGGNSANKYSLYIQH